MHDGDFRLTELLGACDHDRGRLSVAEAAEVYKLAALIGIELYRKGLRWPSSEGADLRGGEITHLEWPRP